MKNVIVFTLALVLIVSAFSTRGFADNSGEPWVGTGITVAENSYEDDSFDDSDFDDVSSDEYSSVIVKDSMESVNRAIFKFNDKMYYYGIKPFTNGYNKVLPECARTGVRKFFKNILFPGRFLNCMFQGKFKGAGTEAARFAINTSMGLAGFFDVAKYQFDMDEQDEDFGQTLAKYGMENGTYLSVPFMGPSTVRDTVGFIGDMAMNPLTFVSLFVTPFASLATPYDTVNNFSLDEGKLYEGVVESSVDPYIAVQDAYIQNRNKKIEE